MQSHVHPEPCGVWPKTKNTKKKLSQVLKPFPLIILEVGAKALSGYLRIDSKWVKDLTEDQK